MLLKTYLNVSFIQGITTLSHLAFGLSLAYFFGASKEMDAYVAVASFMIPLNALFTKAQSKTFIPFIAKYKSDPRFNEIIASILRFNIVVFSLLALLIFTFSRWIAVAIAPGLDPTLHHLSSNIMKVLSFYILFSNVCGLGIGVVEYNLKFEKSAIINLLSSVLLIGALFIAVHFLDKHDLRIYSVPIAHILSIIVSSVIYLYIVLKKFDIFKTSLTIYNRYIQQYIHLLFPIILASVFIWLIRIADTFIASFLDTGSISYLSYCQRIITHTSVFTNSICAIYFPILSRLNEENDNQKFITTFYRGLQALFVVTISSAIFIFLFARPLIVLLFQRGNFFAYDSETVSVLLKFYFLVLVCSPIGTYLANAYFCRQYNKMATLFSVISSVTNIILNCILGYFYGIFGLAAASSIAFLIGNVLQISNIKRINPEYRLIKALRIISGPVLAGGMNFIIIILLKDVLFTLNLQNPINIIIYLTINSMVFFSSFFLLCYILNVEQIHVVVQKVKNKLNR